MFGYDNIVAQVHTYGRICFSFMIYIIMVVSQSIVKFYVYFFGIYEPDIGDAKPQPPVVDIALIFDHR